MVCPLLGNNLDQKIFIKHYDHTGQFPELPANNYWLLREESILSYLSQRGAKVPKVFLKDTQNHLLTLENVGLSFDNLFLTSTHSSALEIFECIYAATQEVLKIFNLGVLHLDIAARNFACQKEKKSDIYVLDFAHSISNNFVLQKPLPLLPQPLKQHPSLLYALKKDWEYFFSQTNNSVPDLEQKFEVSNKVFSEFWVDSLEIQNLYQSHELLSHGIGQFLLEMSNSPTLSKKDRIFLIDLGQNLCFVENQTSPLLIEQALNDLNAHTKQLISKGRDDITLIPIVQHEKNTNLEKNQPLTSSKIDGMNIKSDLKPIKISKKLASNQNILQLKKIDSKFGLFFVSGLIIWGLLIAHIFWLDFLVTELRIKLPDWLLNVILIFVGLTLIRTTFALIKNKFFDSIVVEVPFLILLIEILVTSFISLNTYSHYLLWLPSSLVYLIVLIAIYKSKKIFCLKDS
jgi:hypothetical protein